MDIAPDAVRALTYRALRSLRNDSDLAASVGRDGAVQNRVEA